MAKRRKGKGKATGSEQPAEPEQSTDTTTEARSEPNGSNAHTSPASRSTTPSDRQAPFPTPSKRVASEGAKGRGKRGTMWQTLRSWLTSRSVALTLIAVAAAALGGFGYTHSEDFDEIIDDYFPASWFNDTYFATAAGKQWLLDKYQNVSNAASDGSLNPTQWWHSDPNGTNWKQWFAQQFPDNTPEWMQQFLSSNGSSAYERKPERLGRQLAARGLRAKYPVVLIPGFVTSGLELWAGHECFKGRFRTKIWSQTSMTSAFMQSRVCWMQHLSLNFTTGLDPEGIRVRNAQGLDAIDFFMPGYDVWAKAIEALADIGYDNDNLIAMPYDWRLSIPNLELRDGYFTKLRSQIEMFTEIYDERVLIAGHSWGDNVVRGFLHWMEDRAPGWVDKHVAVIMNCAGPLLGTPKAATSLLSGELRESTMLSGLSYMIGEKLLGKEDRTTIWRTWGSPLGMLPIGGPKFWGNATWAPDDTDAVRARNMTHGSMFTVEYMQPRPHGKHSLPDAISWLKSEKTLPEEPIREYYDAEKALSEIVRDAGPTILCHMKAWGTVVLPDNITEQVHSIHGETKLCGQEQVGRGGDPLRKLTVKELDETDRPTPKHKARASVHMYDPLTTPLPRAPRMRIYCSYGHGADTERAYYYRHVHMEVGEEQCPAMELGTDLAEDQVSAGAHWFINRKAHDPERKLVNGVVLGSGDGTVPLLSLGALCHKHWRQKKLNPAGVKVVTREYKNIMSTSAFAPRGGDQASTHVELLGNRHFMHDFLHAAAGWHDDIDEDVITSNIAEITAQLD